MTSAASAGLAVGVRRLALGALVEWGETVGQHLAPGTVLLLSGDVGAGKTTLAQAVARGAGARGPITSPTFSLVHAYDTPRGVLQHLDLYRLRGPHELDALGWDELLATSAATLIEWPERAIGRWPSRAWHVTLEIPADSDHVREVRVERVAA